ncbi:hypothetical protein FNV43_RR22768 [Rhamnella rubrinervis]|uniref:CCG-binding protein 1 n=1 Tax=Rhamnella rubrinervis TaxID=2594499 RepID=A0A8K0DQS6_9ROSA|nr:hypothetical protein FNV43_RR22768 [Rhamnella rubrinervis]
MIKSALLRSCSSPLLLEAKDVHRRRPSSLTSRFASTITCSSRSHPYIPKLEPFSRSKFDRFVKEPPLIEKAENELADYCSTLEGDESYSCWRAYFELKDLERVLKEYKFKVGQTLIILSDSNLSFTERSTQRRRREANSSDWRCEVSDWMSTWYSSNAKGRKKENSLSKPFNAEKEEKPFRVPDGLPKSAEELEEEERDRMPDSPYTKMLRSKGKFPAWYSPAPDHETD